jgi:hypothetical protein
MVLIKSVFERRPPVAGGAEFDKLAFIGGVRMIGVVGGNQSGNIYQN